MSADAMSDAITVLIVDDEPDMCWALERIIAQMGYQTVSASSGEGVAQLMERVPVELALVDAKLPDMEGIDLAKQLRQRQPGLPIVLVSGYFYERDARIQEWIRQGTIWGFIGKPFVLSVVRKAIEAAADLAVRPPAGPPIDPTEHGIDSTIMERNP